MNRVVSMELIVVVGFAGMSALMLWQAVSSAKQRAEAHLDMYESLLEQARLNKPQSQQPSDPILHAEPVEVEVVDVFDEKP